MIRQHYDGSGRSASTLDSIIRPIQSCSRIFWMGPEHLVIHRCTTRDIPGGDTRHSRAHPAHDEGSNTCY